MDEAQQDGQELIELSDLDVETVGLVYRGAVRKPFFFIKSEDGGIDMAEEKERDGETTAQPVEKLTEPAADTMTAEQFNDRLEKMAEEFTAKLQAESKAREKAEEAFAEEKKKRELAEFTEQVRGYAFSGGEPEQFAEDLWQIQRHDAELYERMAQRFRALDEQVRQGELFSQTSRAGDSDESLPAFEREVEKVRVERFSDLSHAEGWVKAMNVVQDEKPELATRYVREG